MRATSLYILFFLLLPSLPAKDVSKDIEFVGSPFSNIFTTREDAYSRNVWDLQVYDNLLFIGAGNSANEGPSTNSGPIPLRRYNPLTNQFKQETIIYDDQIDKFKILNNQLYIPGHDATGSWHWGNVYKRLDNGSWRMYRKVPNALHLYDLTLHDNKIFAGIGLDEGAAVGITDDLLQWKIIKLGRSRVYAFLNIGNELFALKKFKRISRPYFSVAQYIDGKFIPRYDISIWSMFPKTSFDIKYSRATRIISFANKAIYVGAYKYNSHQTKPFGLYFTTLQKGHLHSKRIKLKDGYVPRDIIKRDNTIYVLISKSIRNSTDIQVLEFHTNNLTKYKTLFSFKYPTFARSFELMNGVFYFGMGSDVDEGDAWKIEDIKKETGNILKYRLRK